MFDNCYTLSQLFRLAKNLPDSIFGDRFTRLQLFGLQNRTQFDCEQRLYILAILPASESVHDSIFEDTYILFNIVGLQTHARFDV